MGRTTGRGPKETRAQILHAASELFLEHGLAASLDQIAARAGVSKGGLKYHFTSKDDLVDALAESLVLAFRDEVAVRVDEDEPGPGRLARAYVKAAIDPDVDDSVARARPALEVLLGTQPSVREIWQRDSQWWEKALAEDGLAVGVRDVVIAAAEGALAARGWGYAYDEQRTAAMLENLLAMATEAGAAAGAGHVEDGNVESSVVGTSHSVGP